MSATDNIKRHLLYDLLFRLQQSVPYGDDFAAVSWAADHIVDLEHDAAETENELNEVLQELDRIKDDYKRVEMQIRKLTSAEREPKVD